MQISKSTVLKAKQNHTQLWISTFIQIKTTYLRVREKRTRQFRIEKLLRVMKFLSCDSSNRQWVREMPWLRDRGRGFVRYAFERMKEAMLVVERRENKMVWTRYLLLRAWKQDGVRPLDRGGVVSELGIRVSYSVKNLNFVISLLLRIIVEYLVISCSK